jgi:hypothetical protein
MPTETPTTAEGPDQDPPAGLSEAGKHLWRAMRAMGLGDYSGIEGLCDRRVVFTTDGCPIEFKRHPDGSWVEDESNAG